jgi:hypothetical protein
MVAAVGVTVVRRCYAASRGVAPRFESSPRLEDLSQEDAVTLLLGGVADSGVTLEPFWSGCTSADDVTWGKCSPLFLHVAYFLYKVQRRRLRTIYHGLNKTAKSQSPDTGMTVISEEQDASAAARDPGESDAEA